MGKTTRNGTMSHVTCLITGGQVTNFYDFGSPSCNDGFLEFTSFPGNNQRLRQIIASPSASCWLQSSFFRINLAVQDSYVRHKNGELFSCMASTNSFGGMFFAFLFIELDDGKIYRKALYLMVKTMVSCRFSLKPTQWFMEPTRESLLR